MKKTVKEWFETLDEPLRSQALSSMDDRRSEDEYETLHEALNKGFNWIASMEGLTFWEELHDFRLKEYEKEEEGKLEAILEATKPLPENPALNLPPVNAGGCNDTEEWPELNSEPVTESPHTNALDFEMAVKALIAEHMPKGLTVTEAVGTLTSCANEISISYVLNNQPTLTNGQN